MLWVFPSQTLSLLIGSCTEPADTSDVRAPWYGTHTRKYSVSVVAYSDQKYIPYSTYYKPMGDLPYISSEQGEPIIHTELIYEYTIII